MLADDGHLIFTTGDDKDIRFQPSVSGRVKVGDEDLSQLLIQVSYSTVTCCVTEEALLLTPYRLIYN